MQGIIFRMLGLVVLLGILAGCSTWHLGIRPDEPGFTNSKNRDTVCEEFKEYATYTQQLQEAYHSRATQNRSWIYVSGTTALGTMATTAGLAAASSASMGTLALVPIIGGFLSGVFAVADNSTLSAIYTIAANGLGTTLEKAEEMLGISHEGKRYAEQGACASALKYLRQGVTETKSNLERARTDSAVAALQRAAAQTQNLNQLAAHIQSQAKPQAAQKGEITKFVPDNIVIGKPEEITLTISNVNLSLIDNNDLKVLIDNQFISVKPFRLSDPKTDSYEVKFTPPAAPPIANQLEYRPALLIINKAPARFESKTNTTLKYKNP